MSKSHYFLLRFGRAVDQVEPLLGSVEKLTLFILVPVSILVTIALLRFTAL
jgi:hypothetical protein